MNAADRRLLDELQALVGRDVAEPTPAGKGEAVAIPVDRITCEVAKRVANAERIGLPLLLRRRFVG